MFLLWQIQQTEQIEKIVNLIKELKRTTNGDLSFEKLQNNIQDILKNVFKINNIYCIIDESQWIQTKLDQKIISNMAIEENLIRTKLEKERDEMNQEKMNEKRKLEKESKKSKKPKESQKSQKPKNKLNHRNQRNQRTERN
ncbi:hypothetical protein M0812_20386 [Anaeramoeba flamelloides]|uniref:Uncharacterized protein n=1 Tax=Anaeramoeba flamelloides TaxID=1746091 RepID=A0AAV7YPQ6_9EUKA|nr:hypothetical protein M0812_20386 [Anaeramoeba flamelloides]